MIPTITEQQWQQFEKDGYFLLENVFTQQEMDELAVHIEAYQKRHEERVAAEGGQEGITHASVITFTDHIAEKDAAIKAFAQRPEFVAITTPFLGPDVDLYWNQSVFKLPEGNKEFPWHQDDGYIQVDPSPYMTLWLALNDATIENGCISVLPGSHKQGLVPHAPGPWGLECYPSDAPDQGIRVPVKAGSLAIFQSLTFHKSGPNVSKGIRKAYVLQYAKAGLKNALTGEPFHLEIPLARGGRPVA